MARGATEKATGHANSAAETLAWLWLVLGFPSVYVVHRVLGWAGVLAYLGALPLGIWLTLRLMPRLDQRSKDASLRVSILMVAALIIILFAVYPWANAGGFGGGSDNDEALNIGIHSLLRGENPYLRATYLGNPIGILPGAFVLAAPLGLLPNPAFGASIAWLLGLICALRWWTGGWAAGISFMALLFGLCPAALNAWVIGSDRLANSIAVLILGIAYLRTADRGSPPFLHFACAAGLGLALAWRINFILIIPILALEVFRARGLRLGLLSVGTVFAVLALVSLPFYLADPSTFGPLVTAHKLDAIDMAIPGAKWLIVLGTTALSIGLGWRRSWAAGSSSRVMDRSAIVLAVPVWAGFSLLWLDEGQQALDLTPYALFAAVFAVTGIALRDPWSRTQRVTDR